MKIDNIFITMINVDSEWEEDGDTWKGWGKIKFHAYGKSEKDTSVNVTIEATPEERESIFRLMEKVTKRVQEEGE